MDKGNPLSTLMVVKSLNIDNDLFRPCKENEVVLGPEVPYLSAIGTLMYLPNCTRHDISCAVNLLARFKFISHKETLERNQTHIPIPSRNC